MRQIIQPWLILLGIALAMSCSRKAYEENVTEEPLFTVKGKINGEAFQMASGQNGHIITASNITDPFGYPQYISNISPNQCTDCGPAFTFILRDDFRLSENNDSTPILSASEMPFMHKLPDNTGLNYALQVVNSSSLFCEWYSGQNPIGNGSAISHTFNEDGLHEISLRLHSSGETRFIISSMVDAGSPYNVAAPFTIEALGNNQWRLRPAASLPEGLVSTQWEINGESFAPGEIDVMPYEGQSLRMNYHNTISKKSGYYEVSLMEEESFILPPSIHIYSQGTEEQRELFVVKYTDANGRKFTSIHSANLHRAVSLTNLGQSPDAIQGSLTELRMLEFDADLVAEDDSTVHLELRDFEVRTGFHP